MFCKDILFFSLLKVQSTMIIIVYLLLFDPKTFEPSKVNKLYSFIILTIFTFDNYWFKVFSQRDRSRGRIKKGENDCLKICNLNFVTCLLNGFPAIVCWIHDDKYSKIIQFIECLRWKSAWYTLECVYTLQTSWWCMRYWDIRRRDSMMTIEVEVLKLQIYGFRYFQFREFQNETDPYISVYLRCNWYLSSILVDTIRHFIDARNSIASMLVENDDFCSRRKNSW